MKRMRAPRNKETPTGDTQFDTVTVRDRRRPKCRVVAPFGGGESASNADRRRSVMTIAPRPKVTLAHLGQLLRPEAGVGNGGTFSMQSFLSTEGELLRWKGQGLPTAKLSSVMRSHLETSHNARGLMSLSATPPSRSAPPPDGSGADVPPTPVLLHYDCMHARTPRPRSGNGV